MVISHHDPVGIPVMILASALLSMFLVPLPSQGANEDANLTPFQGTWSVESITRNGVVVPTDQAQRLVLVVKGNTRIVKDGDEVKSRATFTVNPSKSPKQMDITVSEGPLAGKTRPAVYELKEDTLTLCLTLEGDKRPEDLTAGEGSGRLLQVFKKATGKAAAVKLPELRVELLARRTADQGLRVKLLALLRKNAGKVEGDALEEYKALAGEIHERDENNTAWLKETIQAHGWPGFAAVGKDGAEAAFLLAQHARDMDLQKKCLGLLAAAVKNKDASGTHLAHLTDRVKVASGEKQVYGTELEEKEGTVDAAPIANPEKVDALRKEAGLPPLAEWLKQARRDRGLPDKKSS